MKVQIHGQSIRLRIDEAELTRLLAGELLENRTRLAMQRYWSQSLRLVPTGEALITGDAAILQFGLPRDAVLALQARLPSRDGLSFEVVTGGEPVQLQFDVDVRDSLRQRGPSRRPAVVNTSTV
jgi:hypothetical protein